MMAGVRESFAAARTFAGSVRGKLLLAGAFIALSWAFYFVSSQGIPPVTENGRQQFLAAVEQAVPIQPLQLVVNPGEGPQLVKDMIAGASQSADLVIYELQDRSIEQLLVDAKNRGVQVRVLLQNVKSFGHYPNDEAYQFLQNNGVSVRWASSNFFLTHQKTLIIDGEQALIMTFNLQEQYYDTSRDFGVLDKNSNDLAAIQEAFSADWQGSVITAKQGDDLVWSPGSADILLSLINRAQKTLDIYTLEMDDPRITQALEDAASRGVQVRIVMTYATNWKDALNELVAKQVSVHTFASSAKTFIHAKVIMADGALAFIGSENFSAASLDQNRELGVITAQQDILQKLQQAFQGDWDIARPYGASEAQDGPVKLSKSGICHAPGSASYSQTKTFTPYDTVDACLAAGGRLPKSAQ